MRGYDFARRRNLPVFMRRRAERLDTRTASRTATRPDHGPQDRNLTVGREAPADEPLDAGRGFDSPRFSTSEAADGS